MKKMYVTAEDVLEARERIKGRVSITPLREAATLRRGRGDDCVHYFLKLENLQEVGSFKVRGAFNKLMSLTEEERERGVVAVSSGNHGISVSYAAKQLGIRPVKIFVSKTTPNIKIDKIRSYGAEVIQVGEDNNETEALAAEFIAGSQMIFADPCYRDYLVYGGQGTIGLEILEQNPEIDTIVIPIGGGGLLTGISVAAKSIRPDIRIIGVETEASPSMTAALRDRVYYEQYPIEPSLCEALVGGIGEIAYEMAGQCIDEIVVVKEEYIEKATGYLIRQEQVTAEPSSAICIGAVLQEPERIGGRNVACVISGGNLDEKNRKKILEAYDGAKG